MTATHPSCSTCPWMRVENNSMRCYHEPPLASIVGASQAIAGMPARLVVAGISPEVHPERFCRHHPALADGQLPDAPALPEPKITPQLRMAGDVH